LAERKSYTIVEDDASASSADAESDDSASVRNSDNEAGGSDDSDDFNAQKQGCQDSTPLNGTTKRMRSRLVEDDTDDSNVPLMESPLSSPEAMRDHYSIELQGSLVETNLKLRNEVFNLSKDLDAERRDRKLCDELVAETRKQATADVAKMEEKLKKIEEERARVLSRKVRWNNVISLSSSRRFIRQGRSESKLCLTASSACETCVLRSFSFRTRNTKPSARRLRRR
jgi:hypothetical protein